MNRKVLDIMAVVCLLTYLDLNFLHISGELPVMQTLMANMSVMLLAVPFMSIWVRLEDYLSLSSAKNALVISVSKNQLKGYRLSDKSTFEVPCLYSSEQYFIAEETILENGINEVINELVKDKGKLTPAPYVVIKADLNSISKLEHESLIKCSLNAGGLKVIVVNSSSNDSEIKDIIASNPVKKFA
jgi:hypothetical protein